MESIIGRKFRIIENLDDHVGYKGEELTVLEEIENSYILTVQDGVERQIGIEETDLFI